MKYIILIPLGIFIGFAMLAVTLSALALKWSSWILVRLDIFLSRWKTWAPLAITCELMAMMETIGEMPEKWVKEKYGSLGVVTILTEKAKRVQERANSQH